MRGDSVFPVRADETLAEAFARHMMSPRTGRNILAKISLFPRSERLWARCSSMAAEMGRREWAARQALMGHWGELKMELDDD